MRLVDRRVLAAMLGGAALAFGFSSAGGTVPPADPVVVDDPITVSGQELRHRVTEFVRGTGVARGDTPAARWVDPVCPRVLGLSEAGAQAAEARIRAIAAQAGIEVARAPCDSNVVVTFAQDPGALVREIDRRTPRRLAEVSPPARTALLTGSAPVRWWYMTETRGRHSGNGRAGAAPAAMTNPATHDGSGAGSTFAGDIPTVMHYENSIVSTLTNRVLTSASVVIDEDSVLGMKLDAVAAYAALVAFAEIRSADFAPEGSILTLFRASNAPRGLTPQDRAFLRALYRLPLDREARLHRSLLVGEMLAAAKAEAGAAN
jgi:hypothetical protein